MKGVFSTPVCARKQTNGPPGIDQGFSTGSCNRRHALSARAVQHMKKFYVVLEIVLTGCKLLKMSLILAHIKQTCELHKFTPFFLPYSYTLLPATIVAQFDVAKQLVNDVTLI